MKKIVLSTTCLCLSIIIVFGQNQFKLTFSNQKNSVDVKVLYSVYKDEALISKDSVTVPARTKTDKTVMKAPLN